jgi:acetate kinase
MERLPTYERQQESMDSHWRHGGGLDALVFMAGVGEHAAPVRAAACEPFGFLGLKLDRRRSEFESETLGKMYIPETNEKPSFHWRH